MSLQQLFATLFALTIIGTFGFLLYFRRTNLSDYWTRMLETEIWTRKLLEKLDEEAGDWKKCPVGLLIGERKMKRWSYGLSAHARHLGMQFTYAVESMLNEFENGNEKRFTHSLNNAKRILEEIKFVAKFEKIP